MYATKKETVSNNKCGGCTRRCIYNAKPIKIHNTNFYIPTINSTPTIFFKQPFQAIQAYFLPLNNAQNTPEKFPKNAPIITTTKSDNQKILCIVYSHNALSATTYIHTVKTQRRPPQRGSNLYNLNNNTIPYKYIPNFTCNNI